MEKFTISKRSKQPSSNASKVSRAYNKRYSKDIISQYQLLSFDSHLEEIYTFSKTCEDYLQAMVVKYVRDTYPELLIFSIPNGTNKTLLSAMLFKHTGLLAGASDLFLSEPKSGFHGLFIELKSNKGSRHTDTQKDFGAKATSRGYLYVVQKDLKETIKCIDNYLSEVK